MEKVHFKSFLTKTNIGNYDLTINPYIGCAHGCTYCYAKTMEFNQIEKPWGSFVYEKVFPNLNIPKGTGDKSVFLSSMTDPYQPSEMTSFATRKVLDAIKESNLRVSFLTKSSLITRDIDVFQQMKNVEIGFSISLADRDAIIFEPNASLPSKRIEAIKKLSQAGITTYLFISPIIPYITEYVHIIEELKNDVSYMMFDTLNMKDKDNYQNHLRLIQDYYPQYFKQTRMIFEEQDQTYYNEVRNHILELTNKYNIKVKYIFN